MAVPLTNDAASEAAVVPIGYPIGRFGPVSRAPVEHFLHWNHW